MFTRELDEEVKYVNDRVTTYGYMIGEVKQNLSEDFGIDLTHNQAVELIKLAILEKELKHLRELWDISNSISEIATDNRFSD